MSEDIEWGKGARLCALTIEMNKTIFVCGTDTGVGKTYVTGALCACLRREGIRAGAFKPLESGCASKGRHIRRADSEFLKKAARMPEPLDVINPYYFREPLAPGVAAARQGVGVSFAKIKKNLRTLQKKYDVVFVEGAGGLLVPLAGRKTNLDLIRALKAPVIVVGRLGLGTINHTLLTLEHLRRHRVKILGVILNQTSQKKTIAEKTNPGVLRKYGVPLLGIFPFTNSPESPSPLLPLSSRRFWYASAG